METTFRHSKAIFKRRFLSYIQSPFSTIVYLSLSLLVILLPSMLYRWAVKNGDAKPFENIDEYISSKGIVYEIASTSPQAQTLYDSVFSLTSKSDKIQTASFAEFNRIVLENEAAKDHRIPVMAYQLNETSSFVINEFNKSISGKVVINAIKTEFPLSTAYIIVQSLYKLVYKTVLKYKYTTGDNTSYLVSQSQSLMEILMYALTIPLIKIVANAIEEIKTPRRSYLFSFKVTKVSFWIGTILADLIYLLFNTVIVFFIVYFFNVSGLTLPTLFIAIFYLIPIAIYSYIFAFLFDNPSLSNIFVLIINLIPVGIYHLFEGSYQIVSILIPQAGLINLLDSTKYMIEDPSITLSMIVKEAPHVFLSIVTLIAHYPISILILTLFELKKRQKVKTEVNPSQEAAINIINVKKAYGTVKALKGVTININKGQVFGLLGANGAGKTTLMKILTGMETFDSGIITLSGKLSFCPQFDDHLPYDLRPQNVISYFSEIIGKPSSDGIEIANRLQIDLSSKKTIKQLSGGNRRKMCLCIALMNESDVIVLDEPTSSLDPFSRKLVYETIKSDTRTFVLCTHLLSEADSLCNDIAIMDKGKVITTGSPAKLTEKYSKEWKIEVNIESPEKERGVMSELERLIPQVKVTINRPLAKIASIERKIMEMKDVFKCLEEIEKKGIGMKNFSVSCSTFEKAFSEIIISNELTSAYRNEDDDDGEMSPLNDHSNSDGEDIQI